MEVPSANDDGVSPDTPGPDMLASSDETLVVDLLANRRDPPIPSGASDRRSSRRLGSTSPPPGMLEEDRDLAEGSRSGQGWSALVKDDENIVDGDDNDAPPRLDKGKAPEIVCLQPASDGGPSTQSLVLSERWTRGDAQELPGRRDLEGELLGIRGDLMESAANEEGDENSARATESESQDASYPSSLFDEAQDQIPNATTLAPVDPLTLSKQKQKADPGNETGSLAEAHEEESPFQPLSPGDPGWERSAGRPPRKLPIRFHDAYGRNYVFPWEKAKMWAGMKRLIDSCFPDHDILATHVELCRYDLSVTLPVPADISSNITSPITSTTAIPAQASTSTAEASSTSTATLSNNTSSSQQQKSWFIVLPELWEDTIEPGMLVEQKLWPFQLPNYIIHPGPLPQPQPQPQPPHHHHHHHVPLSRGRGARGRGRGGGVGLFGGGRGGGIGGSSNNSFAPLPPPPNAPRPPIITVQVDPPRGKTRKRQDRG